MFKIHSSLILAFAALLAIFSTQAARADIAPEPLSGGISIDIPPGNVKTKISMVKENVVLDVWPDKCLTTATFWLTNTGGPTHLEVGFPFLTMGQRNDLKAFKASVQDKLVPFKKKDARLVVPPDPGNPGGEIIDRTWLVWPMHFKAGETQKVTVSYENRLAPIYILRTGYDGGGVAGGEYFGDAVKQLNLKQVSYTLYSGAYWHGPIQVCDITVKLHSPLKTRNVVWTDPFPTKREDQTISWHLTNLYERLEMEKALRTQSSLPSSKPLGITVEFGEDRSAQGVLNIMAEWSRKYPSDPSFVAYSGTILDFANQKRKKLDLFSSFFLSQADGKHEKKGTSEEEFLIRDMILTSFELADELKADDIARKMCPIVRPFLEAHMKRNREELKFKRGDDYWTTRFAKMQKVLDRCRH